MLLFSPIKSDIDIALEVKNSNMQIVIYERQVHVEVCPLAFSNLSQTPKNKKKQQSNTKLYATKPV